MSIRLKAAPPPDSDDDSASDNDESVQKRIKLIRELTEHGKPSKTEFIGGIIVSSESQSNAQSSTSATSLSAAEKKGLKEVEELERELDLRNTFSKETNRRDEDAEMKKYIDEQIRQKRLAADRDRQSRYNQDKEQTKSSELNDLFTLPMATTDGADTKVDDILLHQLVKNYPTTTDEKSEAMLSSQMLNGIPEVDLGMRERIKTIEATEEAKLRLASGSNHRPHRKPTSTVPMNYSTNYQHHRTSRDRNDTTPRYNYNNRDSRSNTSNSDTKTISEPVVMVGEEPKEVELRVPSSSSRDHRPPMRGRASDDYHLQKFKKNSRR
uniref:Uncharacterized protein C9orf78 n=1 Tax=Aceria tosichella TaxID=561515 RepID=A0A6G1S617_9ACAR